MTDQEILNPHPVSLNDIAHWMVQHGDMRLKDYFDFILFDDEIKKEVLNTYYD